MAAERSVVTPERVRKILSSFLSDETKKYSMSDGEQEIGSPTSKSKEKTTKEKAPETLNLRSREAFFARVETYSPLTWFAKPEELSALVCSQYGWENTEIDLLRCVSCKAFLCGKLPPNTDQEAYKEASKKLRTSIVTGHAKICTWATNPAPDWFIQVPHYDPVEVRKDFHQRYEALKSEKGKLPDINYTSLSKHGFDCYRCGKLTFSLDNTTEDSLTRAAALAALGWTFNEKSNTLVCQHCRRQAGVWNFRSEVTAGDTQEDNDPPSKKQKLEPKESFDPADEHRTFCPWLKMKKEDASPVKVISRSKGDNPQNGVSTPQNGQSQNGHTNGHNGVSGNGCESGNMTSSLNSSQDLDTSSESLPSPEKTDQPRSTPGWVRNLKIIAPNIISTDKDTLSSAIKRSPMVVGLRSIRHLFHDWATPKAKKST